MTPPQGSDPRSHDFLARLAAGAVLVFLAGCAAVQDGATPDARRRTPFVLGADISALDAPGRNGRPASRVFREDGVASDELTILRRHGWTAFRVRVFVAPVREAPNNTLEAAIPLAVRIKAAGATFLLDLHLSDTWADPQHQEIPVAWRGLGIDELEKQVESYTFDTVKRLKDAGAMPDWVQVGNEITRGTLWPIAQLKVPGSTQYNPPEPYDEAVQWEHLTRLLKAAIRGVMRAAGDTPPRIAIHIDKGANWPATRWFFDHLSEAHVPYDIIAQSFYPEWAHGTLDQLWDNMNRSAERFGKDFLVVETGYGRSHLTDNSCMVWPQTPEGRLQFMADIVNTVRKAPLGIGVMYWAPEWEAWNADGTPGPAVFVMDRLGELTARPASHAPAAVNP
ncbi:MAG TPA: glycosyl hydrolase 53 family protein [Opitutaceae bacterium]